MPSKRKLDTARAERKAVRRARRDQELLDHKIEHGVRWRCRACGKTLGPELSRESLLPAITLHVEDHRRAGDPLPEPGKS